MHRAVCWRVYCSVGGAERPDVVHWPCTPAASQMWNWTAARQVGSFCWVFLQINSLINWPSDYRQCFFFSHIYITVIAFSALTLLVGRQAGRMGMVYTVQNGYYKSATPQQIWIFVRMVLYKLTLPCWLFVYVYISRGLAAKVRICLPFGVFVFFVN